MRICHTELKSYLLTYLLTRGETSWGRNVPGANWQRGEKRKGRHGHHGGAQVHGAHQAATHLPALYFPSYSRYSFNDPERMDGWV